MNLQRGVEFYHEFGRLPWNPSRQRLNRYLDAFKEYDGTKVLGDAGNWYVMYIEMIMERFQKKSKFVYLYRDKNEVVQSYLRKVVRGNHWTWEQSEHRTGEEKPSPFDECYPKYKAPKKEAIEQYWIDYHNIATEKMYSFPEKLKKFTLEIFSDKEKQKGLFDFLEIPEEDRHYCFTICENKSYNLKSFISRSDQ